MKKTVLLVNYEGHQYDPTYQTPWSDTWAKFHLGRKKVSIGPTLISKADLDSDYELFRRHPECEAEAPQYPEGDWKFCLPFGDSGDGVPNVGINSEWVTKALIEQAIGWYIRCKHGVTSEFRFRWRKNKSKLRLHPM